MVYQSQCAKCKNRVPNGMSDNLPQFKCSHGDRNLSAEEIEEMIANAVVDMREELQYIKVKYCDRPVISWDLE